MKLFAVRDNNRELRSEYFTTKKEAKEFRNSLAGEAFITLGPDHWRYSKDLKPNAKKKGKTDWRDK